MTLVVKDVFVIIMIVVLMLVVERTVVGKMLGVGVTRSASR